MTGTPVSGAPETAASTPLADERALERHFRAHFTSLAEEAKGRLGEEAVAAAPRVVEAAYRQAWQDRATFTSEQDLDAFLHEAVRHAAARELSRRAAAHHLGRGKATGAHHHETGSLDVDEAWSHLHRLLHPEETAAEVQAHTEAMRHHAAEHLADMSKGSSWKIPLLIGGIAVVLAAGLIWWLNRASATSAVTRALASGEARNVTTTSGQIGNLTLDDSTRVSLAPSSKLTIAKGFGPEVRAVRVEGAATFTVASGQPKPFEIRAGNAAVVVTGTVVTVRAYPTDTAVVLQVREGQALVKAGREERSLAAGDGALIERSGTLREPSAPELAEATAWTNRRITIADRQVRHVVAEINKWYGVDIKVPEMSALDRVATVDAPLDSLRTAISQVEQSADVEFAWEAKTMIFRTRKAPPPGAARPTGR